MSANRQATGRWGEEVAADYLAARGYRILDRNVRTPYGELDLVAMDGNELVFVEVKARRNRTFGLPEEAVTALKQDKLRAAAGIYLQDHPLIEVTCRFDVIAIEVAQPRAGPEIHHIESAFE